MSLKQNYDLSEKDCPVYENYVHADVCAEIERELAVTKKLLYATRKDVGKGLELADEWAAKCVKAEGNHAVLWEAVKQEQDLRKKLQAEVERLRANLRRAIEIAEVLDYHHAPYTDKYYNLWDQLDALKATLNQDNK